MPTIAIVEDERSLADILAAYLAREGYATRVLHDGLAAESEFAAVMPNLILLDIMLPELDGLTLCRRLRARSDVPIILITARVEEVDRLIGLDLGADDYVCKPFSPREVVARVGAVLRRARPSLAATVNAAPDPGLEIDSASLSARVGAVRLGLTPTEFRLIEALARRPGEVLTRAALLAATGDRDVFDRSIDSHIKNLRRKLTAAAGDRFGIQAVYGAGYRLEREGTARVILR